jgi:hypothetical protein
MWNKYINISAPLPPPSPSSEVASSESAWHQNSLYAPVSELVYDDEEEFESNHASRISSKKSTNSFSTFAPATQSK